ncbi:uncharacterized protein LOC141522696 [Macrotis lagotis]|uniref:uncharacterized protein LOC141522696 n=1 Tax=Macrotis lagotis TaxID=92651 RepID=UPI003D68C81F
MLPRATRAAQGGSAASPSPPPPAFLHAVAGNGRADGVASDPRAPAGEGAAANSVAPGGGAGRGFRVLTSPPPPCWKRAEGRATGRGGAGLRGLARRCGGRPGLQRRKPRHRRPFLYPERVPPGPGSKKGHTERVAVGPEKAVLMSAMFDLHCGRGPRHPGCPLGPPNRACHQRVLSSTSQAELKFQRNQEMHRLRDFTRKFQGFFVPDLWYSILGSYWSGQFQSHDSNVMMSFWSSSRTRKTTYKDRQIER